MACRGFSSKIKKGGGGGINVRCWCMHLVAGYKLLAAKYQVVHVSQKFPANQLFHSEDHSRSKCTRFANWSRHGDREVLYLKKLQERRDYFAGCMYMYVNDWLKNFTEQVL